VYVLALERGHGLQTLTFDVLQEGRDELGL